MSGQQMATDLWQALQAAVALPQVAQLQHLGELLDRAIAQLPENQQLAVAGSAIEQMAEIHALRFKVLMGMWEEADPASEEALPVLDLEALETWIRQSMSLDLDALVEQPQSTRSRKQPTADDTDSVVTVLEPEAVARRVEQIEVAQAQHVQMIQQLAGEEEPGRWSVAIAQWMGANPSAQPTRLTDLCGGLPLERVEIWLGLLLGEFELEQRGEFYAGEVFISAPRTHGRDEDVS